MKWLENKNNTINIGSLFLCCHRYGGIQGLHSGATFCAEGETRR